MPHAVTPGDQFLEEISGKLTEQNRLLGELLEAVRPTQDTLSLSAPSGRTKVTEPAPVEKTEPAPELPSEPAEPEPAKKAPAKKTATKSSRRRTRGS